MFRNGGVRMKKFKSILSFASIFIMFSSAEITPAKNVGQTYSLTIGY